MNKQQAVEMIFQETTLSPLQRNILYVIIQNSGPNMHCYLNKETIYRLVGTNRDTGRKELQSLQSSSYLLMRPDYFVAWPFLQEYRIPGGERRMYLTQDIASWMLRLASDEEERLHVLCERSLDRKDVHKHREYTAMLDRNAEAKDILEKFVKRVQTTK